MTTSLTLVRPIAGLPTPQLLEALREGNVRLLVHLPTISFVNEMVIDHHFEVISFTPTTVELRRPCRSSSRPSKVNEELIELLTLRYKGGTMSLQNIEFTMSVLGITENVDEVLYAAMGQKMIRLLPGGRYVIAAWVVTSFQDEIFDKLAEEHGYEK